MRHDGRKLGREFRVYPQHHTQPWSKGDLTEVRAWCRAFTRGYRSWGNFGVVRVRFVRPCDEVAFKLRWSDRFQPSPYDWNHLNFLPPTYTSHAGWAPGQLNMFVAGRQTGKSMFVAETVRKLLRARGVIT